MIFREKQSKVEIVDIQKDSEIFKSHEKLNDDAFYAYFRGN